MESYLHTLPKHLAYLGAVDKGEIVIDQKRVGEQGIGVVYEDRFIRLVKDPVIFPNGTNGSYVRVINRSESNQTGGAVIVPIIDGKIVFVRLFRHATRSWEIELPRGFQDPNISESTNVKKEIKEELGVDVREVKRIGVIKPNTGLLSSDIAVYGATLADTPVFDVVGDVEIQSRMPVAINEIDDFVKNTPVTCSISISALCLARINGEFV